MKDLVEDKVEEKVVVLDLVSVLVENVYVLIVDIKNLIRDRYHAIPKIVLSVEHL